MNVDSLPHENHRDADRRRHFRELDRQQQADAIRDLAADGVGDYDIAAATGLAVEQVRRVIGQIKA